MVDPLDIRHGNKILLFLLERGEIKKTDLLEIMSSSDSLSRSLQNLINADLIESETKKIGCKVISTKLTPLGKKLAEQLKKTSDILVDYSERQNLIFANKQGMDIRATECRLCGYKNPENAKFSMECRAKLE